MTTTPTAADMPMPAGAVRVEPWYHPDKPFNSESNGEPGSRRFFVGREWAVQRDDPQSGVRVSIDGEQTAEGAVERFIVVDGDPFTPAQARQLADALTAAADEVEQMNSHDEIEVGR